MEFDSIPRLLQDETGSTSPAGQIGIKIASNLLLFSLIFGISATIDGKDFRNHFRNNKRGIITGVVSQFGIMPLLGFLSSIAFYNAGYTQIMGLSLMVITASPGGSYSNWWCSLFNADLALSVAVTSISSILSVALLPANLLLYSWLAYDVILGGASHMDVVDHLDFGAIFISLGVVLAAILSGLATGHKFDNVTFHRRANRLGSICGILLILLSAFLGSGGGDSGGVSVWRMEWSFYIATALPCLLGMALANSAARCLNVTKPETVAIAIETCYQNTAIATSVAVTMYSDPASRALAVAVPFFYGLVEAIAIGLYCIWAWKMGWTKAPPTDRLWKVMFTTYEVHDDRDSGATASHRHHSSWDFVRRRSVVDASSLSADIECPSIKDTEDETVSSVLEEEGELEEPPIIIE